MKAARSILLLVALLGPAKCLFIRKHIFVDEQLYWEDALTYCRNTFVDLSIINTDTEYSNYRADTPQCDNQHCWLGLTKNAVDPEFSQWSDGRMLQFKKWSSGEPNNPLTELCVNSNNGQWYNCICNINLKFTCYYWQPQMVVVHELKTWTEALEHCRTFYTDLISLNTVDDLYAVNNKSLSVNTPSVWIGLRFLDGSWFWVNKEPMGNLPMLPLCPTRSCQCGAQEVGGDAWEPRDCEEKMNFICYKQ